MSTQLSELKQQTPAAKKPAAIEGQFVGRFEPDAWHAMQERDTALIEDQVLHGKASKEFVYEFEIKGTKVRGISVIGARELVSQYGGIKSRVVACVDKTGSLFVFKSFEPLQIAAQIIPQLADEEDFYEVVVEVSDIKTGNSIQVRKKEYKTEKRRDGTTFERPHYDVIAESKAFRNGVLSLLSQSVLQAFEARCVKGGTVAGEKTLKQLQEGCMRFAAKNSIAIERADVEMLTYQQLHGLGEAAAAGVEQFSGAAVAVGLIRAVAGETKQPAQLEQKKPAQPAPELE